MCFASLLKLHALDLMQNRAFINPRMRQNQRLGLSIVQGLAFELFQSKYNYFYIPNADTAVLLDQR